MDRTTIEKERDRHRLTGVFLYVLAVLIIIDSVTTLIGVGSMGATEQNTMSHLFGFGAFMLTKVAVSCVGIIVLYKYCIPSCPDAMFLYGVGLIIAFYAVVCASNIYQITRQII